MGYARLILEKNADAPDPDEVQPVDGKMTAAYGTLREAKEALYRVIGGDEAWKLARSELDRLGQ